MGSDSLAGATFEGLLEAFAARRATPGGISAAALAAAVAAALVERCAAAASSGDGSRRAAALRAELVTAADADIPVLAALAAAAPADRAAAAARASSPAGALRDAATEVAQLARTLERDGVPRLRGEALCAALLAEAAVATAEAVIAGNGSAG